MRGRLATLEVRYVGLFDARSGQRYTSTVRENGDFEIPALLALGAAAALAYFWLERRAAAPEAPPAAVEPAPEAEAPAGPRFPVPPAIPEREAPESLTPLPRLDESDQYFELALVDVLGRMEDRVEIFRYAAGGFRDFTRIASSDPQMWHDICLANRDALARVLERFAADLESLRAAVDRGDGPFMKDMFVRAKTLRDRYIREYQ